mmetsp:Transcript_100958/g.184477  ORF Transcript_100958/g.184477 Transcript_100958/m.184477 type:complete len:235 (-) Transcript_100958:48-752(-)
MKSFVYILALMLVASVPAAPSMRGDGHRSNRLLQALRSHASEKVKPASLAQQPDGEKGEKEEGFPDDGWKEMVEKKRQAEKEAAAEEGAQNPPTSEDEPYIEIDSDPKIRAGEDMVAIDALTDRSDNLLYDGKLSLADATMKIEPNPSYVGKVSLTQSKINRLKREAEINERMDRDLTTESNSKLFLKYTMTRPYPNVSYQWENATFSWRDQDGYDISEWNYTAPTSKEAAALS